MVIFVIAYLIIVPLAYEQGAELRNLQELAYQTLCAVLIFASLFFENKKVKRNNFLMSVGAMGAIFLLLWVRTRVGWPIMLNTIFGISVFFAIVRTVEKKRLILIFKVMSYMLLLAIAYKGLQLVGYDLRRQLTRNAFGVTPDCSFLGLKAAMGMYFAALFPILLGLSWITHNFGFLELTRKVSWQNIGRLSLNIGMVLLALGTMGLFLVPLAVSYSTGAVAAGVVAIIFFLWFRKRVLFWFLIVPLIVGSVFFVVKMDNPMGMQKTRINMWGKVIQDAWTEPLGHGLDTFRNPSKQMDTAYNLRRYYKHVFDDETVRVDKTYMVKQMAVEDWRVTDAVSADVSEKVKARADEGLPALNFWDHPHNEYVWLFYETGFPGMIVLGFMIVLFWRRFWGSTKSIEAVALTASIVAFGVFSLTQFPLHLARVGHLLPILGGLWYVATEDDYGENTRT
jgi:hypothetical protein